MLRAKVRTFSASYQVGLAYAAELKINKYKKKEQKKTDEDESATLQITKNVLLTEY